MNIEHLRNSIVFLEKTERSDTTNSQYSIVSIQFGSGLSGLGALWKTGHVIPPAILRGVNRIR